MAREYPELSAYIDGELSEARRREVAARLTSDPMYARELERLERMRTMLSIAIEQPSFHVALMGRIQQEEQARRARPKFLSRAVFAGMAAAAALLIFFAYYNMADRSVNPEPGTPPSLHEAVPPVVAVEKPAEPTPPPPQTPPPPAPQPMLATDLPLELTGTVLGPPAVATITVKAGNTATKGSYKVGDTVMPDTTLAAIRHGEVDVNCRGQLVRLAKVTAITPYTDANGLWRIAPVGYAVIQDTPDTVVIMQDNSALTFIYADEMVARASLAGRHVKGMVYINEQAGILFPAEGDFNAEWTQLDAEITPPNEQKAAYKLTRVPAETVEAELNRIDTHKKCAEDAEKIAKALNAYAHAHEGRFPATLADLARDHPSDAPLFADSETRTLQYKAGGVMGSIVIPITSMPPVSITGDSSMSIPDQLMAHEKQLQELGMDNLLFPKTILEINYKTVSVVFGINSECRVVDDPQHDPDLSDPDRLSAARIKDQNNLKQLGLVIKMFENEQRDYSPPGWLSVYPEYLADPLILTSPKDKPGTDSYLYLLPATNTNELIRQSQGDLEPAEMAAALSRIPAVLNKTDFPGPNPGRNVLYMDGHVEYDKRGGETWNTIIAPALSGQQ